MPLGHARTRSTAVRSGFSTRALPQWARPPPPPCCHPGLVPGPREAGRGRCLWSPDRCPGQAPDRCPGQAWAPEQVRGDKGGTSKAGESVPQSVSRSGGCAGNPPAPTPRTRSSPSKPDSSGPGPTSHEFFGGRGKTGRRGGALRRLPGPGLIPVISAATPPLRQPAGRRRAATPTRHFDRAERAEKSRAGGRDISAPPPLRAGSGRYDEEEEPGHPRGGRHRRSAPKNASPLAHRPAPPCHPGRSDAKFRGPECAGASRARGSRARSRPH